MISGTGDARIVTLSLRVYSLLLASYPQSFRQQYAAHMLQAFGDYTRRVYLQRGLPGMLWWRALTLSDFLKTVVEEHLQRSTYMTKEKFIRLGSWILMLAGLSMAVMYVSDLNSDPFSKPLAYQNFRQWYWLSFPGLIAVGFAAIRIKFIDKLGPLGNLALLLGVAFGVVGFTPMLISLLLDKDPNMQLLGLNFRIMRVVMVFFGIDALRQHYLPKWRFLPLVTGLVPLIISSVLSDFYLVWPRAFWPFYRPLFYFPEVFALGTFLIGYMLQEEGKIAEEAA